MSKFCFVTKKKTLSGNKRSFSMNSSKKKFFPNLHKKRIWVKEKKKFIRLKVSAKGIKIIDKLGINKFLHIRGIKNGKK